MTVLIETGCFRSFNFVIPLCMDCELRIDCQLQRVETAYNVKINLTPIELDDKAFREFIKKIEDEIKKGFKGYWQY